MACKILSAAVIFPPLYIPLVFEITASLFKTNPPSRGHHQLPEPLTSKPLSLPTKVAPEASLFIVLLASLIPTKTN
jgi:hypothetical protein